MALNIIRLFGLLAGNPSIGSLKPTIQLPNINSHNPLLEKAQNPLEVVNRINNVPFGVVKSILGTSAFPYGGADIALDSRLIAAIAKPPFLVNGLLPPSQNEECFAFWKRKDVWAARAVEKLTNATDPDAPLISLVNDPEELADLTAQELQCVFYLGYNPRAFPIGRLLARPYHVLGSPVLTELASALWSGKVLFETPCNDGSKIFIAVNFFNQAPDGFNEFYLSAKPRNGEKIYEEEEMDDEPSLWVDYDPHFEDRCPPPTPADYDQPKPIHAALAQEIGSFVPNAPNTLYTDLAQQIRAALASLDRVSVAGGSIKLPPQPYNLGGFDNSWPARAALDQVRWVGRDKVQNVDIFLGRAMLKFAEGYRTLLYFNLKAVTPIPTPVV